MDSFFTSYFLKVHKFFFFHLANKVWGPRSSLYEAAQTIAVLIFKFFISNGIPTLPYSFPDPLQTLSLLF